MIRGESFEEEPGESDHDIEGSSPLVRPEERQVLDLASGVRWEELTSSSEDGIDFLHATYEVGGSSTPDDSLMRHHGREYGYIVSGTLSVRIADLEQLTAIYRRFIERYFEAFAGNPDGR